MLSLSYLLATLPTILDAMEALTAGGLMPKNIAAIF
jgi:hypothetical protein